MKRITIIMTLGLTFTLAVVAISCGRKSGTAVTVKATKYHCPMHPNYISDKPGDCPICGMKLVPIETSAHAGHTDVPGRVTILVSPDRQQQIGVTTAIVQRRELARTIRTAAVVEHDETRVAKIAPRFGGWARELYVNYVGQHVEKGEPLLTIYSPELLSTENEYLLALRQAEKLKDSPMAESRASAQRLVEASRRRLELWQIGDEEIRAIEKRGTASDELLLRVPFMGHVVTKNVVSGKAFMAGETLYEVADLSHVWLRAFVYENDLSLIKAGQRARAIFPNLQDRQFDTEVTFIYPHIDPTTRRAELRLELDNPGHVLRPDMWGDVEIQVDAGELLTVPASAILDTGERYIAFVDKGSGQLEPREVKIGFKGEDYYEVREGVSEGERVVTRALFLVDSESQLKAAIAGMGMAGEHRHGG